MEERERKKKNKKKKTREPFPKRFPHPRKFFKKDISSLYKTKRHGKSEVFRIAVAFLIYFSIRSKAQTG
ncbi:MAG: hypothetical protein IJS44_06605 [Clostridia bacterium]|nr:hypothetical protein [Clostridia bacterium]